MNEPARKRRKTASPERPSSSLRKPARRPSFASPTKASLARNYPDLVPPRRTSGASPSRPSQRGDILARGKQARAYVLGGADAPNALSQELSQEKESADAAAGAQNVSPRVRKAMGKRSVAPPVRAVDDELELPATPSQRGLEEEDRPRRGVLFSSPSKRPPVKQSLLRTMAPPVREASSIHHMEDGPDDMEVAEKKETRPPPDPELEKKRQEKARLERQVAELEAEVLRCTEEIAKEQKRGPDDTLPMSERSDLQNFIAKISGTDSTTEAALPVSSLLCSFLPFSTIAIPPRPKIEEKPVSSHRPLELADPLPYLEMFTSMKYSTQLSLPREKVSPSSTRVHQKHTIDIVGPQRLLAAQISIHIDTLANEIIDMHIIRLSPWAERELGTFLRKRAEENDLSNACWAIESFWHIAQKRAQYWHRCETSFSHLLPGRSREDSENARPATAKSKMSRKDLNRHLGRDSLILQDSHVLLKLNWSIGFDWTGEAESEVTIETAFPSVWTEADAAKAFSKVPETFASLVQGRGVFEATRIMVALLFAEQ